MITLFLERIWHDLRHALRVFAQNRAFTAIAVLSIAFGTGANVAIFSAADALLLRPLPVPRPSELMTVGSRLKLGLSTRTVASYPDYVDIRDRVTSFDGLVAFSSRAAGYQFRPGTTPQVRMTTVVSGNFFRVLGVEPAIGRNFRAEEDEVPGRNPVVVLSYGMWKQQFGGDRAVLGQKLRIAGIELTIIGVAPEQFTGIEPRFIREAAFVPLAMWPQLLNASDVDPLAARGFRALTVKGRLKAGVTLEEARAELLSIGHDLERAYPAINKDQTLTAVTELEMRYERNPLDAALVLILSMLSIAVLFVACANVAGLLSSRATVRTREIALRMAIGAGRTRVVRQLITESLVIALAGSIAGLAVGYAGIILIRGYARARATDIVGLPVIQLDRRALVVSLVLAVASAFLFGLLPALQTTRVDLMHALKGTEIRAARRQRLAGRHALVALQVALSLVVLTVSFFTTQVFRSELTKGPGFRTSQLGKLTIDPGEARYDTEHAASFFERAAREASLTGGVRSAGLTSAMPFFGNIEYPTIVADQHGGSEETPGARTWACSIDEGYFATMDIAVIAGRPFRSNDTPESPQVAIVNDTFAKRYWPDGDAVGSRLRFEAQPGHWIEIVGIAKTTEFFYPGEPPQELVYFPFRQQPRTNMVLVARTAADSASVLAPLRQMLQRLDPDVPVFDIQTIEMFYDARFFSLARMILGLIGALGVMGMTLTAVGLYGLVAYAVSRRTREIGIRIAVGATYHQVLGMVLRQGMEPACLGSLVGIVLSVGTVRLMLALIPVIYQYDARGLAFVVPALLAVSLLAAFVPARRAARVDPTVALRYE